MGWGGRGDFPRGDIDGSYCIIQCIASWLPDSKCKCTGYINSVVSSPFVWLAYQIYHLHLAFDSLTSYLQFTVFPVSCP